MKLGQLLQNVAVLKLHVSRHGQKMLTQDLDIRAVQYDSRAVEHNDCFVAVCGTETDGHRYIADAVARGAVAVVLEDDTALPDSYFAHAAVAKIVVENSRIALATLAGNFYGHPATELTVVGITGTNGKTTTAFLTDAVLRAGGWTTGLIGTVQYRVGDRSFPAPHTTPESLDLQRLLAEMKAAAAQAVVMEVSSHALDQYRVHGIPYRSAVFTNLTQDHLDYHGTMERYFGAKRKLFESLDSSSWAVVNIDDPRGHELASCTPARILSYGLHADAQVRAHTVHCSLSATSVTVNYAGNTFELQSPLVGRFNVHNLLAAFATGISLSLPAQSILRGLASVDSVPGRFERITSSRGWTAIVDYAHTPDALEKCLRSVRDLHDTSRGGRLITVFGAGGDRDRTKRPLMGRIAASLSDVVIVTSDNPRTEDPEAIIDEILRGIPTGTPLIREPDRRTAICRALEDARPGDVIVIAGKGHEEYQVVGTQRLHFSDREVVEQCR
jgi:UDP-N-acetylmuramoyl-L-alanyl-D-glutamate--2,6-diaminopimelate ligase